jgi:uncharacterized protein (UPF0264 family)
MHIILGQQFTVAHKKTIEDVYVHIINNPDWLSEAPMSTVVMRTNGKFYIIQGVMLIASAILAGRTDKVRVTVYDHKSHDAPCELRKEVVDTVRQWLKDAGMVEDGSTKVGCHTYCKIVESLHAAKNPKASRDG